MSTLIERLSDEADQCRNDGAEDIAKLLDEARAALAPTGEPVASYLIGTLPTRPNDDPETDSMREQKAYLASLPEPTGLGEWIPVQDRVPDTRREVIVAGRTHPLSRKFVTLDKCNLRRDGSARWACEGGLFFIRVVTHWMEKPKAP